MGPKRVTQVCTFTYIYDGKVAPTIFDGGNELLLANFHGPRSLKCDTKDSGLAKPAPEHTNAVDTREFLCDCQFDLEYASILKQISACGKKSHYDMTLHFTLNLAFWQLSKQYQPQLASQIRPDLKRIEQTFPVKMYDNAKGPLQMPSILPDTVKRLNEEGKKFRSSDVNVPLIFSRFEANMIIVTAGALAFICGIAILLP